MKLVTVKKGIPQMYGAVSIQGVYKDDKLTSLKLTDENGDVLVIEKDGTYSDYLRLLQKAPPAKQKVFTVVHVLAETRYTKEFTDESAAREFMRKLEYIAGIEVSIEESEINAPDSDDCGPICGDDGLPF